MNARVVTLPIRMLAVSEGRRLARFLDAIDAAVQAQAACKAFDTCETMDSAEARDALDAHLMAEDRVLGLALDPELATFLGLVLKQLTDISGEVSCA